MNKSYLFISLIYLSFVCDPIDSRKVGNNIKSLFNIINSERYLGTHPCYPSDENVWR